MILLKTASVLLWWFAFPWSKAEHGAEALHCPSLPFRSSVVSGADLAYLRQIDKKNTHSPSHPTRNPAHPCHFLSWLPPSINNTRVLLDLDQKLHSHSWLPSWRSCQVLSRLPCYMASVQPFLLFARPPSYLIVLWPFTWPSEISSEPEREKEFQNRNREIQSAYLLRN